MLHFRRNTPEREEWWAISDQTGEIFGSFDPGTVWFETPPQVRGSDLLQLQRVADLILNEAHASWERLQRALAFMQPNGSSVYRRFMDSGVLPRQTPALGLAGGLDVPGYLGDGGAIGAGLHIDDAHNGTTISGFSGATQAPSIRGDGAQSGYPGEGPGRGLGGPIGVGNSGRGGGGGGYGTAGGDGQGSSHKSVGGSVVPVTNVFAVLQANSFTRDVLGHGSGGGSGSCGGSRDDDGTAGLGGSGGSAYVEIAHGTFTTAGRSLQGSTGGNSNGDRLAASGGGGAGGLWLAIAQRIVYGSGSIDVSGGSGGTVHSDGGAGGNGRVVQAYFDSKADNLQVTGGVQDQFRILRSVPIGQNTFL